MLVTVVGERITTMSHTSDEIAVAMKVAQYTRDHNGGTFWIVEGGDPWTITCDIMEGRGYSVAMYPEDEYIVPLVTFSVADVLTYFDKVGFTEIGTWVHDGKVYFDHIEIFNRLEDAMKYAKMMKQIAIFDLANMVEIEVK